MKRLKVPGFTLAYVVVLLASTPAFAGPYTDDLAKCLVSSTTTADRNALVKWMFAATSTHPAVKSLVTMSAVQIDEANKTVAALFVKLLAESCKTKTQEALKYEGKSAIDASFTVLCQVAGRELFSDPNVAANMAGLQKYFDKNKLQQLGDSAK